MGIGGVTSTNSMPVMQMTSANLTDQKSKSIQNEITNVQRQVQKLSSNEEPSVNEKANERKKLQKEISDLNTELKQHQEELRKSGKREIRIAELQEEQKLKKEEKSEDKKVTSSDKADEKNLPDDEQQTEQQGTVIVRNSDGVVILKGKANQDEKLGIDTEKEQADEEKKEDIAEKETVTADSDMAKDAGLSRQEMQAIVSADSSAQQANRQGTIIAKTRDGIAILKGEINQDEKLGVDTERKQAELEKMEEREQRATAFQSALLGEAMKSAAETNATEAQGETQVYAENNAFINALNASQEGLVSQQSFHVSIA